MLPALLLFTVFPLDTTTPGIESKGIGVEWTEGWDAMVVASSLCIRINQRGIYSIPAHWTARDVAGLAGWKVFPCLPHKGSLCADHPRSDVFPYGTRARYNGSQSIAPGSPGCDRKTGDGRVLVASSDERYDLSTCDVLDQGGDLLLCQHTAAFRSSTLSSWVYWLLCVIAVYIIRSFSYLVASRLESDEPSAHAAVVWWKDSDTRTVGACSVAFLLVLIPDGSSLYVTTEETIFVACIVVYMVVYLSVFFIAGGRKLIDPPIYNLIAGTLQLIAMRLYTGIQTPYNPVLIWAVATRAFVKFTRKQHISICEQVTLFVDSMLMSLMCVLGFDGSACYLVAIITTAITAADVFPND